jgi:hypothetical protein
MGKEGDVQIQSTWFWDVVFGLSVRGPTTTKAGEAGK